ncbi:MAG: peptide chain release factor N(5)-glutamine methyltransferase [Acholeplasmataceae bacterium]|jgi:release factor glutamine methyltransferase|nr:peptide chain release factor N(5)-glutamine methyltransferase [Acholeplasmataceae bacterium]
MTYQQFINEQTIIIRNLNKEEQALRLLLMANSGFDATQLYQHYQDEMPEAIRAKTLNDLHLYLYDNRPVQYIIGYTYFYGLKILVNNCVLIPRPETELLVEEVLKRIGNCKPLKIIDVGTGSGAIALAVKTNYPDAEVIGIDISEAALELAEKNAKLNKCDVRFIKSNLFENIPDQYDILISNPPYIDQDDEIESIVKDNEPALALFAPKRGLFFYEEIFKDASRVLKSSHMLVLEIPENKDEELKQLIEQYLPESIYEILKDWNGNSRILIISQQWR